MGRTQPHTSASTLTHTQAHTHTHKHTHTHTHTHTVTHTYAHTPSDFLICIDQKHLTGTVVMITHRFSSTRKYILCNHNRFYYIT